MSCVDALGGIATKVRHQEAMNDAGAVDLILKLLSEERDDLQFAPTVFALLSCMAAASKDSVQGAAISKKIATDGMYAIIQARPVVCGPVCLFMDVLCVHAVCAYKCVCVHLCGCVRLVCTPGARLAGVCARVATHTRAHSRKCMFVRVTINTRTAVP